jgi:uncharacterized heparinase superfamily protein
MPGAHTFRFLGTQHSLATAADWNRRDWPRLWLYNLHYFDDLVADGAERRTDWHRALVQRWVDENPPGQGAGWEPYPTSLRVVNWVKWALAGHALDDSARHSLAVQARWLRRRLEIHLLGNHLWANAKALVFAGVFFSGDEAQQWLAHGMKRIRHELAEQILADGGHFERSPMYHAIVLEDLLDLLQLAMIHPAAFAKNDVAAWREVAARMLRWLRVMSHPDGGIALFNDAALGIAPDHATLRAYAAGVGVTVDDVPLAPIEALPDSGYVRLESGAAVLIADVGAIGPDHLPGHAHADTLSFELSVHGARVLVNSGTSTYETGAERLRQRGTAAHNTVVVDGQDSSEVWSSFRVARRARAVDVAHGTDDGQLWLRAAHDGYRRLPGRPVHHREWRLSEHALAVSDDISGTFGEAVAHVHVHPEWRVETGSDRSGTLMREAKSSPGIDWHFTDAAHVVGASYHPAFGTSLPCQAIEVPFEGPRLAFSMSWT